MFRDAPFTCPEAGDRNCQPARLHVKQTPLLSRWQESDAILLESLVARNDRKAFREGLGDQHPIERILVMAVKRTGADHMSDTDRQRHEPARLYLLFKVVRCDQLA